MTPEAFEISEKMELRQGFWMNACDPASRGVSMDGRDRSTRACRHPSLLSGSLVAVLALRNGRICAYGSG
jgi:hypothetical protein